MSTVIVRIQHILAAGYCVRGARTWAKEHGVDFKHFLRHGMPAEQMEAYGDPFCMETVRVARNEVDNG
jgi:hypothetical protein